MPGFYDATNHDDVRQIQFRRIDAPSEAVGTCVWLEDAAIAKLPPAVDTMPFADLVTYDAALVNAQVHVVGYDAGKGPLYISTQPVSATPKFGANATFTVAASAGSAGGTKAYVWYHNGAPVLGALTATLTITGATQKDVGEYYCIVTSAKAGPVEVEQVKSAVARLDLAASVITAVGQIQYSADAVEWANSIPNGVLVAGSPVNFFVRANPATVTDKDPGNYVYQYAMATVGAGGLSLRNQKMADGTTIAQISGITPADQVGQTFSVNCTVKDSAGTEVAGTTLSKAWA